MISLQTANTILTFFFILSIVCTVVSLHSPVAQQAEQVAVNHWVRGSNPRGGALKLNEVFFIELFYFKNVLFNSIFFLNRRCPQAVKAALFSDTELRENSVKNIITADFTGNSAEYVYSIFNILNNCIERKTGFTGLFSMM